jgi:NAD(P) transhydrogenase subunit alpha
VVVAITFGTINVVGGFLVTDRMLGLFKGKQPARAGAPQRTQQQAQVGGQR